MLQPSTTTVMNLSIRSISYSVLLSDSLPTILEGSPLKHDPYNDDDDAAARDDDEWDRQHDHAPFGI